MKIKFYSNLINLGRDERNLTVQLRVQINKDKVLISSSEITYNDAYNLEYSEGYFEHIIFIENEAIFLKRRLINRYSKLDYIYILDTLRLNMDNSEIIIFETINK